MWKTTVLASSVRHKSFSLARGATKRQVSAQKTPTKITGQAREDALRIARDNGWELAKNRDAISRTFLFGNFVESWGFMSQVALISEKMDHHPEW